MLRLFSVVLPQKKLMAPKTDVLWIGAIVCSTVVGILFSYNFAAGGACYRDSAPVQANTMNCDQGTGLIAPLGFCPTLPSADRVPCGTLILPAKIVIGTIGNMDFGTMDQEILEDPCWLNYSCEPTYTLTITTMPGGRRIPVPRFSCKIKGDALRLGKWKALHASGLDCVKQNEGPIEVPSPRIQ